MRASQTVSPSDFPEKRVEGDGWRTAERMFLFLGLLLFSEALLGRLFATPQNPEGGALLRIMWLPVYAVTFLLLFRRWRRVTVACSRSPFLVLLCLMAIASALWSLDPATSFRRGIAILGTTAFGLCLAVTLTWKEMLRMLGLAWLVLGIGSFIAGALVPGFGVMQEIHPGAWRGLWFEKNQMGGYFARSALLFAFLVLMDRDWRKRWLFAFLLSAALVLLSTSKTSLLGLVLGLSVLGGWVWMRSSRVLTLVTLWAIFSLLLAGILILTTMPETVASLIGRDLTLTGRTDIWEVLFRVMEERPLLGYGYGTFWAEDSPPAMLVRAETQWDVPTAHNGLIEVMLALGQIGAALFILDYLMNLLRALFSLHVRPTSVYAFGALTVFLLFSISESVMLTQNNITWVMYCAIAFRLSLDAARDPGAHVARSQAASHTIRVRQNRSLRGRLP